MELEIKVPEVGESITEVTIAQWLVKDGDYVDLDQVICELDSDKATFELTAEKAGKIKILANEGDDIPVGDVVCTIDTNAKAPISKPVPIGLTSPRISDATGSPEVPGIASIQGDPVGSSYPVSSGSNEISFVPAEQFV